jgi:hypothetical protein
MKLLFVALALSMMIGCGSPGAPQPPSLNLPMPVVNLSAVRIGNSVRLNWTMPTRTTDRVVLKHPVIAGICRASGTSSCASIAKLTLPPAAAGTYTDKLPPDLTQGPDSLLRYEVALINHAGKSAGPSNAAYSAGGPAPSAVTGLAWQMRAYGVLLSWVPATQMQETMPQRTVMFRMERLLLNAPATDQVRPSALAPAAPPAAQTLMVHARDGMDPGHSIDTSIVFNQRYRYVVERVAQLELDGHTVEIQGSPSEAVEVLTKDTFAPAVPQGLVAVADTAGAAIDLSWTPDSDSDLAAYRVYRRDVQGSQPAQRISSLNGETSFRDTAVQPEHTYSYSVSAIDQSGNESSPSAEVQETLPRP